MTSSEKLLKDIESFLAKSGMAETTFCRQAVGDSTLAHRLRSGKSVTLDTADAIRAFMKSHRPRRAA